MPRSLRVPVPTLERLATYLRYLNDLEATGVDTISSSEIEQATGIHAAQFRKDLSYFGEFGRPGIGYNVYDLQSRLAKILKVEKEQPVILVGAGNLGSALIGFPAFRRHNFHIVAAFDNDKNKIGQRLWDLDVLDVDALKQVNEAFKARIAIIAVPASAAQVVTDQLVEANVRVILNFAPTTIRVPEDVVVRNVCFIQELAVLSYHLSADGPDR
ncbi:MAG: redox-sensing transcriptional repressor Rex [Armatimonadetes bacterium]|nr:redox-sensing transcriptional repressor Rex [Armatimonadota bacterium]